MSRLITALRNVLSAEPLRMVVYGALLVVWVVTHVAAGRWGLPAVPPDLDALLIAVTAASAAVTEFARRWVTPITDPQLPQGSIVTVVTPGDDPNREVGL